MGRDHKLFSDEEGDVQLARTFRRLRESTPSLGVVLPSILRLPRAAQDMSSSSIMRSRQFPESAVAASIAASRAALPLPDEAPGALGALGV